MSSRTRGAYLATLPDSGPTFEAIGSDGQVHYFSFFRVKSAVLACVLASSFPYFLRTRHMEFLRQMPGRTVNLICIYLDPKYLFVSRAILSTASLVSRMKMHQSHKYGIAIRI